MTSTLKTVRFSIVWTNFKVRHGGKKMTICQTVHSSAILLFKIKIIAIFFFQNIFPQWLIQSSWNKTKSYHVSLWLITKTFCIMFFFSLTRIRNWHMHLFYIHHEHVLYIVYFFTTAQSLFLDIFVSCFFFSKHKQYQISVSKTWPFWCCCFL